MTQMDPITRTIVGIRMALEAAAVLAILALVSVQPGLDDYLLGLLISLTE